MELLLTVRTNNGSKQEAYSHCFDESGGTIGRSARNDWTLVDPDRYISERHARVKFQKGGFVLTDLSTNGTYLNDDRRRIRKHDSVILESGDELSMGNLQIDVRILGGPPLLRRSPEDQKKSGRKSCGGDTIPLAELQAQAQDPEPEPQPAREHPRNENRPPHPGQSDISNIPEEWRSLVTGFFEPAREHPASRDSSEDDGKSSERISGGNDATHAMLQELGIEQLGAELDSEDVGREVGRILRMVAGGLMEALKTRAEVKDRFRIEPTRMRVSGNNPLKSSGTLESALRRLFREDKEGAYIRGVPAFREALEDLHIHELAMLSAVHASIEGVIADFDPRPLKKKLRQISPVSAATPVLSSAKCWNLYEEHYQEVAAQLRDDARLGFLKEFAKAYENATEQLRINSKQKQGDK